MSVQDPPRAARETCHECDEEYWLSEENQDHWRIVCPHCGALR